MQTLCFLFVILLNCCRCFQVRTNGGWFPVVPINSCVDTEPIQVKICGSNYVVWKNPKESKTPSKGWNVMEDACPHRLAPLSEGRVDAVTGCLECPYHGWQFKSGSGKCMHIPQSSSRISNFDPKSISASSYPVHVTGNLLWAYLPIVGANISYNELPETIVPEYANKNLIASARELPYSFDMAVENLMDPAHVPFAHHKLQGTRDDAMPIEVEPMTKPENASVCAVWFKDRTRKVFREGITSFQPPVHFKYVDNRDLLTKAKIGTYQFRLSMALVPVTPGRVRAFTSIIPPFIFSLFPLWYIHAFNNRFMESDIWVHDEESYIRNPVNDYNPNTTRVEDSLLDTRAAGRRSYSLVTVSDKGVIAWRKWWKKHMSHIPIFGAAPHVPSITDFQRRDRYNDHIRTCKSCLNALERARKLKRILPALVIANAILNKRVKWKILGFAVCASLSVIANSVMKLITGKERWEPLSAAKSFK